METKNRKLKIEIWQDLDLVSMYFDEFFTESMVDLSHIGLNYYGMIDNLDKNFSAPKMKNNLLVFLFVRELFGRPDEGFDVDIEDLPKFFSPEEIKEKTQKFIFMKFEYDNYFVSIDCDVDFRDIEDENCFFLIYEKTENFDSRKLADFENSSQKYLNQLYDNEIFGFSYSIYEKCNCCESFSEVENDSVGGFVGYEDMKENFISHFGNFAEFENFDQILNNAIENIRY